MEQTQTRPRVLYSVRSMILGSNTVCTTYALRTYSYIHRRQSLHHVLVVFKTWSYHGSASWLMQVTDL